MQLRGRVAVLASAGMVTMLAATTLSTAAAAPSPAPAARPAFCATSGPIQAAAIGDGVSAQKCDIVGRAVVSDGMGVTVPKPGHTAVAAGMSAAGSRMLSVRNRGGTITVQPSAAGSSPAPAASPPQAPQGQGGDPECVDETYRSRSDKVKAPFEWRYNSATTPERLDPAAALKAIRAANDNLTEAQTDCGGLPELDPAASGAYRGDTDKKADIYVSDSGYVSDPVVFCGAEDHVNVVDWGDVGRFFAYTCWWTEATTTTGADISFGVDAALYTDLPAECASNPHAYAYDLQGAATHEWGHVYGLGHVDEDAHPYLTMSPSFPNCSTEVRTLGLGDWLGMFAKYGAQ